MLQNLPPKRVCRQILPQLNQKQKNKKSEEKPNEPPKVISGSESSPKAVETIEECTAKTPVAIVVTENKKSSKVKNIEKIVDEIDSNGNDAILADKQKMVKTVKTIRKANQKLTKDNSEDKSIDTDSQKNENKDDDTKKKLRSSPRNQSSSGNPEEVTLSVVSPVKRRPKKISDCIAKLQEKLGLPFFGTPVAEDPPASSETTTDIVKPLPTESVDLAKTPIENDTDDKLVKTPKRKSLTRKIVKTESLASLPKKIEQPTNITIMKAIQIQTVHPTIQHHPTPHFTQKPIAHVEAIRPKHFSTTNHPPRRPSILLPTLVPPPPPPPIILPSTVTLPCELNDTPLDLSRKPAFENGALDLSKASKVISNAVKAHSIADILTNRAAPDSQPKRRRNKKEVVSVPPIPKSEPLPIVRELKNKLPSVSVTPKCVLNIPQTPTFDKSLESHKKAISENTQLVIPNFKGCVDIIKIPAPKTPIIHTEKPSVTIKAIPLQLPQKASPEKPQEKGFIGAFESFIEKKAADNSVQPALPITKEIELTGKAKQKKPPKKSKGKYINEN